MQSQSNNGYAACFSPHTGLPLVTSHLRQPRNKFTDTRCMVFRMVYTKTQANNFRTLRYIRFCSAKASAKSDFARQRPSQNLILPVKGLRKIRFCPSKAFAKSESDYTRLPYGFELRSSIKKQCCGPFARSTDCFQKEKISVPKPFTLFLPRTSGCLWVPGVRSRKHQVQTPSFPIFPLASESHRPWSGSAS